MSRRPYATLAKGLDLPARVEDRTQPRRRSSTLFFKRSTAVAGPGEWALVTQLKVFRKVARAP